MIFMMGGNPTVAKNIAQKLGQQNAQGGIGGDMIAQQPGSLTDSLVGALRALQTYSKTASEVDPKDPDVSLVRKIMQAISMLVAKDQQEGQGSAEQQGFTQSSNQGMMGGGMGGGMEPPTMPDLDSIVRGGGGMMG